MNRRGFFRACVGLAAAMVLPAASKLFPAPPTRASQINDLLAQTLRDLGKPKFTEIATDAQRYVAMRSLLSRRRVTLESGQPIEWKGLPLTS